MDLDTFRTTFPEFGTNERGLTDVMVQRYLDMASAEVDPEVWGGDAAQGVGYLAAHLLVMSPYGAQVRNNVKDINGSTYLTEYKRRQSIAALCGGTRVV
jgi:hypothetical protein